MRPSPATLRPLLRHVHPELGRVTTPPECDAAGLAALCFFELLATRHEGPLRGVAPEKMLSCEPSVAAVVLFLHSRKSPWTVLNLNDAAEERAGLRGATHVKLTGNLTVASRDVLADCESLTAVDLTGLTSLTKVGEHFLVFCTSLTAVDLSGLPSLTQVEDDFLSGCTSLTAVDLSGLTSLTQVGSSFLDGCTSLTSVDVGELIAPWAVELCERFR